MSSGSAQGAQRLAAGGLAQLLLLLLVGFSAIVFLAALKVDQPMLMTAGGLAIVAAIFAWSQPFIICALFIAFSYFRISEAYPFLEPMKPALLLGTAAVGLVAAKALLSPLRESARHRSLKSFCLLSLVACVGLAVPFSFLRASGTVTLDPLLIPAVMISAALCAYFWTSLLSNTGEHPLPVNVWLFTAFFILICVTTVFSAVPGDSYDWWSTITWRIAAMTLAAAWLVRTERDLTRGVDIFIVSGVLISLVVFYNKAYGLSLSQGTRVSIGRIVSDDPEAVTMWAANILSDPNDLALILIFPLSFAIARIVQRRNLFEGLLAAAASVTILLAIVFTQSRGAAIGVLFVFAMLLLQRYRSAVLGLMAIVVAGPIIVSAMNLANRDSSGFEEFEQGGLDESAGQRVEAWETAVKMASARPLTGVGISNFPQMYFSYTDYWRNRQMAVHSMWFQILGELGFVALGVFIAMLWTSYRINAQTIRWLEHAYAPPNMRATALGLQAALAGTCASGTFLSQAYTWPVYIIVALIAALANHAKSYQPSDIARTAQPVRAARSYLTH